MSRLFVLAILATALLTQSAPADGQTIALRLSGSVLDAETLSPLGFAYVSLRPVTAPDAAPLIVWADSAGHYFFEDLHPGRYVLRAGSVGYADGTVEIALDRAFGAERLSIGLTVDPIVLERVDARTTRQVATFRMAAESEGDAAVQLEMIRQRRFLEGDARLISAEQTQETQTLGEPDLLRAFERLPGISTRDEYTTELWIRGASWSRASLSFDGIPLFSPLHAGGILSAISSDVVGNAALHPGVQPAGPLNGTAGAVVVETRRPEEERTSFELTTLRVGASAEGLFGTSGEWILALRRSHLDVFPRGLSVLRSSADRLPYLFYDVAGRASYDLLPALTVEASGVHERDRLDGEIPDILVAEDATRGSSALRMSVVVRGAGELRVTGGFSRLSVQSSSSDGDEFWDPASYGPVVLPGIDNAVTARFAELRWAPDAATRTGVRLTRLDTRIWTDGVWPYRQSQDPFVLSSRLGYATVWLQHRMSASERFSIEPGLTVDVGRDVRSAGSGLRIAPRVSARYLVAPPIALSIGAGRSYQYARPVSPAGAGYHRLAFGDLFWLLADTTPPLRSDIATVSLEHWLAENVLLSASAYARAAEAVTASSWKVGYLRGEPLLTLTDESARGAELHLRKLSGRWTGSVGYAWAVAQLTARDSSNVFAAPFDRRHTFDALLSVQLPWRLRVRADYVVMSGAPYTRFFAPGAECKSSTECVYIAPPNRRRTDPGRADEPSAQRAEWYRTLDLGVRWSTRVGGVDAELFGQLHNVLGRRNRAAYRSSGVYVPDCDVQSCEGTPDRLIDETLPGLPRVPSLGLRAWF